MPKNRKNFFSSLKYPKFLLLLLTFILAYILFAGKDIILLRKLLSNLGYFGTFLAGMFYSYGFTAAPATAILLILSPTQNTLLAGILGGLGSVVADLVIFHFIRSSFHNEIEMLRKEAILKKINAILPKIIKKHIFNFLACCIIASPLPDEIGVTMLAVSKNISTRMFMLFSFLLNTTGILIVLLIGKSI
jgi:hypothetical protein